MNIIELRDIYFLVFFILFWFGALTAISLIGGWKSIAKEFPGDILGSSKEISKHRFASLLLRYWTVYRFCVTMTIFEEGIKLIPLIFLDFSTLQYSYLFQKLTGWS